MKILYFIDFLFSYKFLLPFDCTHGDTDMDFFLQKANLHWLKTTKAELSQPRVTKIVPVSARCLKGCVLCMVCFHWAALTSRAQNSVTLFPENHHLQTVYLLSGLLIINFFVISKTQISVYHKELHRTLQCRSYSSTTAVGTCLCHLLCPCPQGGFTQSHLLPICSLIPDLIFHI